MLSDDKKRKQVEHRIAELSRQVGEMDNKIRAYLADRQRQPHPRHLEFIQKVQNFHITPDVTNRHLETLLDNLQWKVYYHQRSWKQLWENSESARNMPPPASPEPRPPSVDAASRPDESSSSQYSIDNLWEIQKEKLRNYGIDTVDESKSQFKKRMISEYRKLNQSKAAGQEIVMSFDREEKKCRLEIKNNKN